MLKATAVCPFLGFILLAAISFDTPSSLQSLLFVSWSKNQTTERDELERRRGQSEESALIIPGDVVLMSEILARDAADVLLANHDPPRTHYADLSAQ